MKNERGFTDNKQYLYNVFCVYLCQKIRLFVIIYYEGSVLLCKPLNEFHLIYACDVPEWCILIYLARNYQISCIGDFYFEVFLAYLCIISERALIIFPPNKCKKIKVTCQYNTHSTPDWTGKPLAFMSLNSIAGIHLPQPPPPHLPHTHICIKFVSKFSGLCRIGKKGFNI